MPLLSNPPLWLRLVTIVGLALLVTPAFQYVGRALEADALTDRCFDDYDSDYIHDPVQRAAYCEDPYWRREFLPFGP